MLPVEQPFKTFTGLDGKPLDNGYVYFGLPNQNPITAPVTVYWDAAGTIPAAQPLRTMNGYVLRAGTPANVFFDGAYSELVLDSKKRQVFYARTSAEFSIATTVSNFMTKLASSIGATLIGWANGGTPTTVADGLDMLYYGVANVMNKKYAGGAKCDGATDDWAAIQAAINSGARIVYLPGRSKTTKTLKGISTATVPIKLLGQGIGASIIDFQPATYDAANDTAVWFGNSTENKPAAIYECANLVIEDLSIYVNTNTRVGLRLRETQHTSIKRVFIGPEAWETVTNLTCLLADGAVHCNFEMLDLAPRAGYTTLSPNIKALRIQNSATLDRASGSGSGAGFTSTSFRNCYFHYAGIAAEVFSTNDILFDTCIFESCHQGVQLYDVFLPQLMTCYYESLNTYPICVNGVDVRAGCNLVVSGGYYQANGKSGYNNDSFVYAQNAGKIVVRDVQMYGAVGIGQQVTVAGFCHSIQIDAKPWPQFGTGTGHIETAATNPFATTTGSNQLTVTLAGHGRTVGDTVGFRGFTTPLSAIAVNQQYCRVTAVVDGNTFKALPIIQTTNANATAAGLGGAGTIVFYPSTTWVNAAIAQPNRTRFNDAEIRAVDFQRAFTTAYDAQYLGVNGDPAMTSYILDKWAYVMYAYKYTNIAQPSQHTNYCYLHAKLPAGYEQDLILNTTDGSVPAGSLRGAEMLMGVKLPPGTVLSVNCWAAGGVAGVNYAKTDGVRVFIAETNDQYYLG